MMKEQGLDDVNLTVGGVIPHQDIPKLKEMGVAEVFPGGTSFEDIITGINKLFE
jgi:methylmalonyl-CoA mutase C-terminal domain/subunit